MDPKPNPDPFVNTREVRESLRSKSGDLWQRMLDAGADGRQATTDTTTDTTTQENDR